MKYIHMITVNFIFTVNLAVSQRPDGFPVFNSFFNRFVLKMVIPHDCSVRTENILIIDIISIGTGTSWMIWQKIKKIKTNTDVNDFRRYNNVKHYKIFKINNTFSKFVERARQGTRQVRHLQKST